MTEAASTACCATRGNSSPLRTAGVNADSNSAELALRSRVIIHKISGGSRSAQASTTRLGLASAVGTWQARHLTPLAACIATLR